MKLPHGMAKIAGKVNTYAVDPDIYFPEILKGLGVETPDRYWLEIASGIMKIDCDLAVAQHRRALEFDPGRNLERLVRADDGRKARWNLTQFPQGKDFPNAMGDRARLIRTHYRALRGFVPA